MAPLQRNLRNRPPQQTPAIRNKKDFLLRVPVRGWSWLLLRLMLSFGARGAAKGVVEVISELED
jgi:hypothetical protein